MGRPRADERPVFDPVAPFLRWAGGKRWIARFVGSSIPEGVRVYREPFLGSGAVFFAIRPVRASLSDSNQELIGAFRVVRDSPSALIAILKKYRYDREQYYRIRSLSPSDPVKAAARLIYLNRSCWNGLYRVNRRGE